MNYLNYLKTKSKTIVIIMIINVFAFFVNLFKIDGKIDMFEFVDYSEAGFAKHQDKIFINFFTKTDFVPENGFWPFANTFEKSRRLISNGIDDIPTDYYIFRGVFYNYDISEFIAYTILLFVVLYFKYEKKSKIS